MDTGGATCRFVSADYRTPSVPSSTEPGPTSSWPSRCWRSSSSSTRTASSAGWRRSRPRCRGRSPGSARRPPTQPRENEELCASIFSELIESINFPIVISRRQGRPHHVEGPPGRRRPRTTSVTRTTSAPTRTNPEGTPFGERDRVLDRELDRKHDPIPMTHIGDADGPRLHPLRRVEHDPRDAVRARPRARWRSACSVLLGFLGFRNAKLAELRSIWVGLAKETAHQLGTPISSLMGWVELISEIGVERLPGRRDGRHDRTRCRATSSGSRRSRCASTRSARFRRPKRQDLVVVLRESVDYLRRQAPVARAENVEIVEDYEPVPPVEINRELMEWVDREPREELDRGAPGHGGRTDRDHDRAPAARTASCGSSSPTTGRG